MARLYLDECIPLLLGQLLTQHGHDVIAAMLLDLRGRDDPFHLKYAVEHGRILITKIKATFASSTASGSQCSPGEC
jgi:hypothetical protein